MSAYNCIVVLGPTASGKTRLACRVAHSLNGEVISADSRQVYRQLDIGTGKDLAEYIVDGVKVPHHLIDIVDPSEQFYLHEFIRELEHVFEDITDRGKLPVICGGTGLYLDALRKDFRFTQVTENIELRRSLENKTKAGLLEILSGLDFPELKNTDTSSVKRVIRAIEIGTYLQEGNRIGDARDTIYRPYYIGITINAEERRKRIEKRLRQRLEEGMIDEVGRLLDAGITPERLIRFGLEYKFITEYLTGKLTREKMESDLLTAIVQYSKRQMTWFRRMEKEGVKIHWWPHDCEPGEVTGSLRMEFNLL
jgi:tRNA dimethylallyltransferase